MDIGEPLVLLRDVRAKDDDAIADVDGYAVDTSVCGNPQCDCTRMWLDIRPVRRVEGNMLEVQEAALRGEVSSDGTEVELAEDASSGVSDAALRWIRMRLGEQDQRAWLAERWRRARGQLGDPAYPPGTPPEGVQGMVALHEVFPYDFDLTVVHGDRRYLIEDHYCLEPGCSCDQLAVHVVDLMEEAEVGHLRVAAHRLDVVERQGPVLLEAIWTKLLERHGRAKLRERFERMRGVARARDRVAPFVRGQKVGRNDACVCGSGKKFKRCCGKG